MEPQLEPQPTFFQKYRLAFVLVVVVIVLGAVLCFMMRGRQIPTEEDQAGKYAETDEAIDAVSATIITEESISSNPVEDKLPDLNPVAKANPYASYKNPFE